MIKSACCLVLIVLLSCAGNKASRDVLPPAKMQAVFWDIMRAEVYTGEFMNDSVIINRDAQKVILQKKIFLSHGVTKEQFYKSFDYYTEHPEEMTTMLDSMLVQENRRRIIPTTKSIEL